MLGLALVGAAVAGLVPLRSSVTRTGPALVLVLPVMAAGVVGGRPAALAVALVAAVAFDLAFLPPYWTPKVDAAEEYVALAVFAAVAAVVGTLAALEADRRRTAEQRADEVAAANRRYEDLADERERLAEEANRAVLLERVDEQRAALLRSVSQDLRTPLATIRAVATDLRDGAAHDAETRRELLDAVCDEAERLDRLVANLLSMSRIEAGALRPERQAVDVDELVADRVRHLAPLFRRVRVQAEVPPDLPLVDGDYSQLGQVVTNLLENAARHAPPGSTVRVGARSFGSRVEVRVADEGIGVPDYQAAALFEPFRRGEGSASSGVGLAICKAVVEAHGGTIGVERTPGGGATFAFTLPVHHSTSPAAPHLAPPVVVR